MRSRERLRCDAGGKRLRRVSKRFVRSGEGTWQRKRLRKRSLAAERTPPPKQVLYGGFMRLEKKKGFQGVRKGKRPWFFFFIRISPPVRSGKRARRELWLRFGLFCVHSHATVFCSLCEFPNLVPSFVLSCRLDQRSVLEQLSHAELPDLLAPRTHLARSQEARVPLLERLVDVEHDRASAWELGEHGRQQRCERDAVAAHEQIGAGHASLVRGLANRRPRICLV